MSRHGAPRQAEAERNDRALLQAARDVLAIDGAHATVASIAARAGVGIGSLYRRYRTKAELFQRLTVLSIEQWIEAADQGLADSDPWAGLAGFVRDCVEFGQGSLAPIAGTIEVTTQMRVKSRQANDRLYALVARAHDAGVLRPDVTTVDITLLIEQLGGSAIADHAHRQGRTDLLEAAIEVRTRIVAIALDGLRAGRGGPLPGRPPTASLLTQRWAD